MDFNAKTVGQRVVDDPSLYALVQGLSKRRLGLDEAEPDVLGRAYKYLPRKFAEGQGQSVGEFYTPRKIAMLMVKVLTPSPARRFTILAAAPPGPLSNASLACANGLATFYAWRLPGRADRRFICS